MSRKTLEERAWEMAGDFRRRIEAVTEALTNTSRPPDELSLRVRHLPDARLRRDIGRLRSGVLQPRDPSVKAGTLADDLEKELACRLLSRQILAQVAYMRDLLSSELESVSARMSEQALAAFRAWNDLPEARDSTTALSASVRRLHRLLHDEQGRSKRKGRPAAASDIP
jgi:hypothetical protein